ncbi:hypothetical protein BC828DRAFT_418429 [Blastocladiella britannica]|nr:hypothetical protein BC828DRAFT_418429 [Blastocladiella britannica]
MPPTILDLPDTVLRSILWHLSESEVLYFRTVSKLAAQSHLVLADPALASKLALIVGDEELLATRNRSSSWYRRSAYGRAPTSLGASRRSADALSVLLAWKTCTGRQMLAIPPIRGKKYQLDAALEHPRVVGRPNFADWLLTHLDDFLTARVPPSLLLHAIAIDVPGLLTALHRVLPVWHVDGPDYTNKFASLANMPRPIRAPMQYACMIKGKDLMKDVFAAVPKARDPVLLIRAILAALLIGRVNWRPNHPMTSRTAVVVDFGPDMTPTNGIAALRSFLVQSAGGNTDVADGLITRFEKMPPEAVRNALVSFAPAATDLAHRNLDLVSAILTVDPPSLSTILDHEAVRFCVPPGHPLSKEMSIPPSHHTAPLWVPWFGIEPSLSPVISAINRCEACRVRLRQHFERMDKAAKCEWGVVVNVPALFAFQ